MPTQAPSVLNNYDIGLGNCILYYAPTPFASFSACQSATTWRKFGLMDGAVNVSLQKTLKDFWSGFPAKRVLQYVESEDFKVTGNALEINPRAVARAMGGLTITETVKSSSPAPTTVASGSTKSVVNFTSAAGYKVNDEIRVGNAGNYQYGRIKSIAVNAVTLYEDLSGDANPTTTEAIAKIDTTAYATGSLSVPAQTAAKLTWSHTGGYGTLNLFMPTVQLSGNLALAFADNSQNSQNIVLPIELAVISDPAVENGNTAQLYWQQS